MPSKQLVTIITPEKGVNLRDIVGLWNYRELLFFLTWRDIKVRYKQTVLGVIWAIVQPLVAMIIFTIFFGRLVEVPSNGIPYPIFAYSGLLPWYFFSNGVSLSSNSLIANSSLLTKIYFPRILIPVASVLGGGVDFLIAFVMFIFLMPFYGVSPTFQIIWLPIFIFLGFISSLGGGLWLSALNVKFRDVRHIVPFLLQIWFFATPVVYPSSLLVEPWLTLYGLNPIAGVIEGFRWALFGTGGGSNILFLLATVISIVVFFTGIIYFEYMERTFADII